MDRFEPVKGGRIIAPNLVSARPALIGGFLALATAFCAPGCGYAQDYEHVAPKLPPAHEAPMVTAPVPTTQPSAASESRILSPDLKGLVFRAGMDGLAAHGLSTGAAGPTGVAAPDLPALRDVRFQNQMRAFLGKPFTAGDLARITAQTRAWLASHDHPFVDVSVPPQNITSGVIQVVVTEYRLGDIDVVGARYFSKPLVRSASGLKPGETITLNALQEDLARLNENPFLSVDAVFKPGQAPGTTDLELRVKDRFPVRVYVGYDNQGYRSLGLQEFDAGVNWGNAFGTGQILSAQYTRSFTGRFTAYSASDVIPLPWRDKLLVFGSYARLTPLIADGFNNVGHSGQASVRYVHTLPKLSWLTGHIQLGYDYKSTDNNLEFAGLQVIASAAEVHQFPVIYDGLETDRFGQTAIENDLIFAPGGLGGRNTDAAFQSLTPGASARYVYDRLSVTRTTRLPAGFTWVARAVVQRSSAILPSSEQLGGGGVGSARGYYPDTGIGSNGELISQEIRLPAFSPAKALTGDARFGDLAQFGLFYDAASLRQPTIVSGGAAPLNLASVGVFIHYSAGRDVGINLDFGRQLRHAPNERELGQYAAVAVVFGF